MKITKYLCLILFLVCLALIYPIGVLAGAVRDASSQAAAAGQGAVRLQDIPTNQIIVKYKDPAVYANLSEPAQEAQAQRLSAAAGVSLEFVRLMSGEAQVFRLPERLPTQQVDLIAGRLMALPEVAYAEPDAIMQHTLTPNDPRYTNQWHYFAPSAGNYGINAPAAWDITTGSASIVAAVIDTGITNHADLAGRTVPGYDFIHDALVGNDGNERDNDPSDPGDWITPEENASGYFKGCPVSDSSWHGTHTAGTVGAASNNSTGVAGVNWNSKILPVRVLGKCGGYLSDIVDGMRWAAGLAVSGVPNNANPAKVLNLSLGGPGACDATYQSAVNEITAAGKTVVVSAGNDNANAVDFRPANCNGVITVAATNRYGSRAYYSNYGSTVEISAPGGETSYPNDPNGVLSTLNTGTKGPVADTYTYYQGTSMAAPHVTGVISLLYSIDPSLTPAQVLQILQSTVTNFPGGSTCNTANCGSGIVNAGLALQSIAKPGPFSKSSPTNGATVVSTSPTLSWDSSARATSYEYCYDDNGNNACDVSWTSAGANTSVGLSGLADGKTYYWHVRAVNAAGVTYSNGNAWWSFTVQAPPQSKVYLPLVLGGPPPPPPAAPTNLVAAATSSSVIHLTWNDNANNEVGYYVERSPDGSTWSALVTLPANSNSHNDTGLLPSTLYYYRVRAYNNGGTSDYSNTASATTQSCTSLYFDDFSNPSSGWPVVNTTTSLLEYSSGEYRILVRPTNWGVGASPGFQAADYSVEVDLRNVNNIPGSYGITFGIANDWSTFYSLEIYQDGWYGIYRYDEDSYDALSEAFSSAINLGAATNHIKVERNGASIMAYANGQLLASVTDGTYTGTRYLGLVVFSYGQENVDIRFDNFRVNPLACGGLTSPPITTQRSIDQRFVNFTTIEKDHSKTRH